jgi:small conductance mechanosensitive channel
MPAVSPLTLLASFAPHHPSAAHGAVAVATGWFDWLIGEPLLQSGVAIVVAVGLLALTRWLVTRAVRSVVDGTTHVRRQARRLLLRSGIDAPGDDPLAVARRVQRAQTMGSVLRSTAALVIGIVAVTALANIWGWDLGPVLASAGVVGVALGFGAQTLVKDFLSGIFMLVEDQYGVGDVVDLGEASGVVEAIGLRVTQVRDLQGTLWYVRNGEVLRVGNLTQGWSRAFVEVLVPPERDVAGATERLRAAAASIAQDEALAPLLLDEPSVTAYEDLSGESVKLRAMIKTVPGKQWDVQRALRARIREEFTGAGVALALPQSEVRVHSPAVGGGPASGAAPTARGDQAGGQDQKISG